MIPRGWKIERQNDVLKSIHITAPNGYVAIVSAIDRNPEIVLYMLADSLLKGTDAEIYKDIAAGYASRFQGGLSNDDLRDALKSKLPRFQHSDRDLTMFALGVEVGASGVAPAATGFTDQQMCDAVPETATLLEPLQGPGKVCMTRQELRAFAEGLMRSLGVEGKTNG